MNALNGIMGFIATRTQQKNVGFVMLSQAVHMAVIQQKIVNTGYKLHKTKEKKAILFFWGVITCSSFKI
jgi:hypothetical protein